MNIINDNFESEINGFEIGDSKETVKDVIKDKVLAVKENTDLEHNSSNERIDSIYLDFIYLKERKFIALLSFINDKLRQIHLIDVDNKKSVEEVDTYVTNLNEKTKDSKYAWSIFDILDIETNTKTLNIIIEKKEV